MERKPNFERLRKVLMLEGEPDRVPLIEIWIHNKFKEAILGRCMGGEFFRQNITEEYIKNDIEFHQIMGYDYIHIPSFVTLPWGGKSSKSIGGLGLDPQEFGFNPKKGIWIKNSKDFEKYPWDKAEINFKPLEWAVKYLPQEMKVLVRCEILTPAGWLLGPMFPTPLFEMLAKKRKGEELVNKIIEKVAHLHINALKKSFDFDDKVGGIWIADDIAWNEALFFSPKYLRKSLFPWFEEVCSIARSHNLPVLYHTDGNVWGVIEDLISIGINALHPIEQAAMDIHEVKERVGSRLCLLGGIDLDYPLIRGTPEEVDELVKKRIKEIAPGGGYAIGSSNTVYEEVPFINYKAMVDAVYKYGDYPINL